MNFNLSRNTISLFNGNPKDFCCKCQDKGKNTKSTIFLSCCERINEKIYTDFLCKICFENTYKTISKKESFIFGKICDANKEKILNQFKKLILLQ